MRRFLFCALVLGLIVTPTFAQTIDCSLVPICTKTDGTSESGWVVSIPAGTSDYFNTRFDCGDCDPFNSGIGEVLQGVNIKTGDFGASASYPRLGLAGANLGLDPSGGTPDCGNWVWEINSPPEPLNGIICGPGFCYPCPKTPLCSLPGGIAHVVVQFPPGDPGLLGICADTDAFQNGGDECMGNNNPFDSSYFTTDCYSSPAIGPFGSGDWFLSVLINPEEYFAQGPVMLLHEDTSCGDYTILTTMAGNNFGVSVFAPYWPTAPTLWLLFISFLGVPIQPVGPVLPMFCIDKDGDTRMDYSGIKFGASWPLGAGNLTINFVFIAGCPGVAGSVGISNEVTVYSLPDPGGGAWGSWDDCTYEGGWVVSIPSGTCDYFAVYFDPCPGGNPPVFRQQEAVMDFGTSVTAYPNSGVAPPNLAVDPNGLAPDLGNPYVNQPFPFPSLTFVTSCNTMVVNTFTPFTPAGGASAFIRFPFNDPGLLGQGSDQDSPGTGKSSWSLDCYSSANPWSTTDWGIRIQ